MSISSGDAVEPVQYAARCGPHVGVHVALDHYRVRAQFRAAGEHAIADHAGRPHARLRRGAHVLLRGVRLPSVFSLVINCRKSAVVPI